ncbi:beta-ketoacyl-ACP synthase [Consotaella salsifontis]|uniref:3-oxoacyl-[acyl-carrier-protein] synthase II n=1 Tax=Consotaella salsifontis TaxID=1365950 RepID=A0A1T4LB36_9HYPH|nr:beta-ketoacyl-ACP synthase [Consotaella salsifontis]SJZ51811.1 3-oxoacyl-[acyl-carrier-protein] synthase II [Consotaella salsifontis]
MTVNPGAFSSRPAVAVTGLGAVSSLGIGIEDNFSALKAGKSGIKPITRFSTEGLRTTIAGTINFITFEPWTAIGFTHRLADMAAREAVAMAGIDSGRFDGPLVLAAPPVELEWPQRLELDRLAGEFDEAASYDRLLRLSRNHRDSALYDLTLFGKIADQLADSFGTRGLPITLSTACASGATAVQLGVEAIRRGEAERVLVVGADGSVGPEAVIRFSLLSALSTQNAIPERASKPFSKDRDGFVMAEGAGALVLESVDAAKARGAEILGYVLGCGEKADDFHRTRSSPDGSPIIATIRAGLADAGLAPEEISYINAHGTSTPENDKMEYTGLAAVFGDALASTPISSNKSMIGHTLTAAGAIEAVFSILTMREGVLPPTINYDVPDPAIPLDTVPNVARSADVATVISNSFGFGGQNVSLVFGREPRR